MTGTGIGLRFTIVAGLLAMFAGSAVSGQEATKITGDSPQENLVDGPVISDDVAVKKAEFFLLAGINHSTRQEEDEQRAMLGVHTRRADQTLRQHLEIGGDFGLVIEHVTTGSAAATAKLQPHDVLLRLDKQILVNREQFQSLIDSYKPNDEVELEFYRDGKLQRQDVELGIRKVTVMKDALLNLQDYHSFLNNPHGNSAFGSDAILNCANCHQSGVDSRAMSNRQGQFLDMIGSGLSESSNLLLLEKQDGSAKENSPGDK